MKTCRTAFALAVVLALAGCGSDQADLARFVKRVKARPAKPIAPIPKMATYTPFQYNADTRRGPFSPTTDERKTIAGNGLSPNPNRRRDPLEAFPLDALRMVGTISSAGVTYALVAAPDNIVHRVARGDHLGENDGRITAINPGGIALSEIVPDGVGGYTRRPAAIALAQ